MKKSAATRNIRHWKTNPFRDAILVARVQPGVLADTTSNGAVEYREEQLRFSRNQKYYLVIGINYPDDRNIL